MKKRLILPMLLLAASALSAQQVNWTRFSRMMIDGEYKNVYEQAKAIYDNGVADGSANGKGSDRLAAAFWMARAADKYQEDAYDSAVARYRSLLPELDTLERALCYAFLGSYDSALMHPQFLQRMPASVIQHYCDGSYTDNMTPTVYDVIVTMMQDRGGISMKEQIAWQRKLCYLHSRDDNDDLRIWHDLRLLSYLDDWPVNKLTADTVQRYINKYRYTKSKSITQLYYLMASELCKTRDYVRALDYCDTAIRIAPESRGGVDCANLAASIKHVYVWIESDFTVYPGQQSLLPVRYNNVEHLWFRLVDYYDAFDEYDTEPRTLRGKKPLMQWDIDVPSNKEYRSEASYVAMPALKTGRYVLIVSPTADFKKQGLMAYEVNCTDMQLVQIGQNGLLLDRRTGRPIVGQEVKLIERKYDYRTEKRDTTLLATVRTDRDGRFHFDSEPHWNTYIVVDRNGFHLETDCFERYGHSDTVWGKRCVIRTDRPIYKSGDTMHVVVLRYVTNSIDALASNKHSMQIILKDPNNKDVDSNSVATDEFGIASTTFVLPKDRLPGTYRVEVSDGQNSYSQRVRVEEYKQPKFMVTMSTTESPSTVAPQFGEPYTVKGMAASYSAVPVSGAKVKYTVERRQLSRWWWYYGTLASVLTVASGETTTAADGSFEITFTPEPDSSVDLGSKPCFQYLVKVDVTDINGESHPASTTVRVGYRNAFISLDGPEHVRTLDGLKPLLFDLNGNTLPGEVAMKIELLRQPEVPLLDPPTVEDMTDIPHQTMSEADYRKAFPLFAYSSDYNNLAKWPVASLGWNGASGVYRITLTADEADTVVVYRTVTAADARKVQSQRLLWNDIDKHTAEVGDTVMLRFGSRFKDVEVYYWLRVGSEERDFRRISVSDQLKSISIVVDSAMLGGFTLELVAVREGITELQRKDVSVPFNHKKLDVEIATFRNKLQPGETEDWTIRVGSGQCAVDSAHGRMLPTNNYPLATIIMTMYDDALNSYGGAQEWGFSPWRTNSVRSAMFNRIYSNTGWYMKAVKYAQYNGSQPSVWRLLKALPSTYNYGRVTMQGNVRKRTGVTMKVVDDEVPVIEIGTPESGQRLSAEDITHMPGTSVESIVAAVGGIGYSDGSANVVAAKLNAIEDEAAIEEAIEAAPQVRTNLNTLAFFVAGLRTDSTGTATYSFTVPELLTRWNVRGLAVTKDIKLGTIDKTLVTSKQLMVQPNMPRFLRQGDSIVLMAKVMNVTDNERKVRVNLGIDNAADSSLVFAGEKIVTVPANGSVQVSFPIGRIPQDLYVATCTIIARTIDDEFERRNLPKLSDGECSQLPVVSSRQAVTVSQAMYINGAGEKSYTFNLPKSATAEPRLVAAELTSNPIWLAIKSMPYLKTQENPSTLYLANQLFVNSKGRELVKLVELDKLVEPEKQQSRLSINEDVKQTLLQATPWVRDAESEEEQMAAVRNYFDTAALDNELRTLTNELTQRQNADGGWSWMPEGKSSVWTTQQVLKTLAPCSSMLSQQTQSALEYIDNEYQRDYEKYYKPSKARGSTSCKPVNIDYLYTRSFYGKANTEAYKFYYSNALKSYKEYDNLYTQTQLAIIFHRHGDHKAALDLLRRLKQKALESDEMGMYWRDNKSGWWWYQRPIETQALLIQAFAEITPEDTICIGKMQQWLLKQKQSNHWGNDQATTKAIAALMVGGTSSTGSSNTSLTIFGIHMSDETLGVEGYQSQRWSGSALDSLMTNADNTVIVRKKDRGIAWGAVYYQFTDDIDKIPSSAMGITVNRSYSILDFTSDQKSAKVGDRMLVSIEITCDRAMDYLELIDGRPSCVEPLSTRAGWRWTDGLSYYITVNNTDTRCYIEHIDKGKYVFEYEVYVTNPGIFLSGPVTMQCMYAPEFRATAPAQRIVVE